MRSQPTEPERSGFVGDLSEHMETVLQQLRTHVRENNQDPLDQFDDYDFLRFCRARKFDWPAV
jgi:hypothetical protein